MNFLAHAYLSFQHPEILVGNLISDFVKGKKRFNFPASIQQGITLHRLIDQFTDEHEATSEAKAVFRPHYRLYSAVFVDVAYDHFLAKDDAMFDKLSLYDFSQYVYSVLDKYQIWFPERFGMLFYYMKMQNWLFNYRSNGGIKNSFGGIVRRATYLSESDTAFDLFVKHYEKLQYCYQKFFPDLLVYSRQQFLEISGQR